LIIFEIETGGLAVLEETRRLKTVLVKAESVLLAKNLNNYTPFTLASTPNLNTYLDQQVVVQVLALCVLLVSILESSACS
jgi:hypothetical protein